MEPQPPMLPSVQPPPIKSSDDQLWIIFSHLSILLGVGLVVPLIIYLVKKDESPRVSEQAKEALNFHISILIYSLACVATCVGAPLAIGIGIAGIVFAVIAAVKSSEPGVYRYPLTLRLVK